MTAGLITPDNTATTGRPETVLAQKRSDHQEKPELCVSLVVKNCTKIVSESDPKSTGYLTPRDEELLSQARSETA